MVLQFWNTHPYWKNSKVNKYLIILFFLNILDAIFTWLSVSSGKATEVNFVPNILFSHGPLMFFTVKIGLVSLVLIYVGVKGGADRFLWVFKLLTILMSIIVLNVAFIYGWM